MSRSYDPSKSAGRQAREPIDWRGASACPRCGSIQTYYATDSLTGMAVEECRECGKRWPVPRRWPRTS